MKMKINEIELINILNQCNIEFNTIYKNQKTFYKLLNAINKINIKTYNDIYYIIDKFLMNNMNNIKNHNTLLQMINNEYDNIIEIIFNFSKNIDN